MKRMTFALAAIALIGILSAFATNKNARINTKYEVIQIVTGSPDKYEVKLVDITGLTQGTASGQYQCLSPFTEKCTITVNSATPDGYLDAPVNQRPFYYANSVKLVSSQNGDFKLNP